jgi:hypothetical protein
LILLADEEIQLELELIESQKSRLNELRQKVAETEKKWLSIVLSSEAVAKELNHEFQRLKTEQVTSIDEVLLPHQEDRFSELKVRFLIRRNGLAQTIFRPEYFDARKMDRRQIKSLGEELGKKKTEFIEQCQRLYADSIDSLVEVLNEKQQREIALINGKFVPVDSFDLELLSYYLRHGLDEPSSDVKSSDDIFESLENRPFFDISPSGRFREHKQRKQLSQPPSSFYYFELLSNENVQQALELAERQDISIKHTISKTKEKVNLAERELFKKTDRASFRDEFLARKTSIYDDAKRSFVSILNKQQREALVKVAEKIEIARTGLLYALLHGRLGQKIEISSEQSKNLRDIAEVILKKIEELSLEIEDVVFDEVKEHLSVDQIQKLNSLVGEKLAHCPPNIGLLIRQLPDSKKKSPRVRPQPND